MGIPNDKGKTGGDCHPSTGSGECQKTAPEELLGINEEPTWKEVLLAIRKMDLGTAPGHDDIPVEMYKSMLKEECHNLLASEGTLVGDNIYVALPEVDPPGDPQTLMGLNLFRIILGVWTTERQPGLWSQVMDQPLAKGPSWLQEKPSL